MSTSQNNSDSEDSSGWDDILADMNGGEVRILRSNDFRLKAVDGSHRPVTDVQNPDRTVFITTFWVLPDLAYRLSRRDGTFVGVENPVKLPEGEESKVVYEEEGERVILCLEGAKALS
jgi:hypothetical protein